MAAAPRVASRREQDDNFTALAVLLLGLLATAVATAVCMKRNDDLADAKRLYRAEAEARTQVVARSIERIFEQAHRSARVIARLPGVGKAAASGVTLDAETRNIVADLFHTLEAEFEVTDLTIARRDDLLAGDPRGAILALGRGLGLGGMHPEDELARDAVLRAQVGKLAAIVEEEKLHPMLVSRSLIVEPRPFPGDDDEAGRVVVIATVPIRGNDSAVTGCVALTLDLEAIRAQLGGGHRCLVNRKSGTLIAPREVGQTVESLAYALTATVDPDLPYSSVRPLGIRDAGGEWVLWSGEPREAFLQRGDRASADRLAFVAHGANLLLLCAALTVVWLFHRNRALLRARNDELGSLVAERTAALAAACDDALAAGKAKSAFVANMSHEIRTPLNGVIGMTAVLRESKLDDDQAEAVEMIRSSGEALLAVINDILDFSKIEAGRLELEQRSFDLVTCVERCVELVGTRATEKGIELLCDIDPQLDSSVVGDETRLSQIVINLLSNAVKFTAVGSVTLRLRRLDFDPKAQRARISFEVRDTGIGIPHEALPRLFDPFVQVDNSTTRQFGGTGLGLAICRQLATLMGSDIVVDTELGVGSTFRFEVSFGLAKNMPRTRSVSRLGGCRVLLVESHPEAATILATRLADLGIEVAIGAEREALPFALETAAGDSRIDAIILDPRVKDAQGSELAPRLAALRPSVPIVQFAPAKDLASSGEAGFRYAAHLLRPFRVRRLERILVDLLAARAPRADADPVITPEPEKSLAETCPLRILLAEDNVVNQRVMSRMLARLGYVCDVATDGEAAVLAALATPYDLILMDVQMPRLDGIEATRRIRDRQSQRPPPHILALTANAMREDRERCLDSGMDGYLTKPIQLEALAQALREAHETRAIAAERPEA
jgi:signal transduction histidine kinase/DNA-binding response OmpR family regulator